MNCKTCDKLIEQSKTHPRVFCSDSCRKAFKRKITDKKITDNEITDEHLNSEQTEQVNPNKPKYPIGSCHACGEGKETFNGKLCICRECIGKGITHKSLGLDIRECEK